MKTKYKHIYFERDDEGPIWDFFSSEKHDRQGYASFYTPWKQWVAEFYDGCVFNNQCLRDIADFLNQLNSRK